MGTYEGRQGSAIQAAVSLHMGLLSELPSLSRLFGLPLPCTTLRSICINDGGIPFVYLESHAANWPFQALGAFLILRSGKWLNCSLALPQSLVFLPHGHGQFRELWQRRRGCPDGSITPFPPSTVSVVREQESNSSSTHPYPLLGYPQRRVSWGLAQSSAWCQPWCWKLHFMWSPENSMVCPVERHTQNSAQCPVTALSPVRGNMLQPGKRLWNYLSHPKGSICQALCHALQNPPRSAELYPLRCPTWC